METMLFPFEKIKVNSRIIIYGLGMVGKQYWLQLNKSRYCEVVLWVDRAWDRLRNSIIDIKPVEEIFNLNEREYDYLVVAIENEQLSITIKNELIDRGVPEEKIICSPNRYIGDSQFGNNFDSIDRRLSECCEKIKLFWSKTVNNPEKYFPPISETFFDKNTEGNFLEYAKKRIQKMTSDMEKIVALRMLYDMEYFDGDCMKMFQKTLLEMEWVDDTPLYMIIDSSHMIHYGIATQCIYSEFYKDRRELLKRICETYDLVGPKDTKKRKIGDIKRIAVLGFRLDYDRMDPATELVVKYTEDLIKDGYEAKLFITNLVQELKGAKSELRKKYILPTSTQKDADKIDKTYDIFFAEEESPKRQMQEFINQVVEYNPDLILDMSDDFCPQMYLLHKAYPVLCFPMRVGMSSSFFDFIYEIDEQDFNQRNAVYHSVDDGQCLCVKLANMLKPDETTVYQRQRFGLEENSFVVVTVGGRLSYELDADLLGAMSELLKKHENIRWLLVGDEVAVDNPVFMELKNNHHIINTGWENHIEALYRICDAYLEPRRSGGSHGMRLAMRIGLPVVIADNPSDNRCLFNEENLCHNVNEMTEEIELLYIDEEYRRKMSGVSVGIIRDLTKERDSEKLIKSLLKCLEQRGLREIV